MTAPHPAQEQDTFDLGIEFPGRDTADIRQWRLEEVQIANWGTMDGRIHRFPVSRRGHLITGPSGSGKSSILDAIAAVLADGASVPRQKREPPEKRNACVWSLPTRKFVPGTLTPSSLLTA